MSTANETLAITTVNVLSGVAPVLVVVHDDDDDWQYLCGTTNDPADGRLVHPSHLKGRDRSLAEVDDLPLGWRAFRASSETPWSRQPS